VAFDLTDEQSMIKSMVERFVQDRYPINSASKYQSERCGFSQENWATLGELGIIGTAFSAENGGLGADDTTLSIMFEAFGYGSVVEPMIDCVFEAGRLFERGAAPELAQSWLPKLIDGSKRLALAHTEYSAGDDDDWVGLRASLSNRQYELYGEKSLIVAGLNADGFVVSGQTGVNGTSQTEFFFVPADTAGLTLAPFRLIDGAVACQALFDHVRIPESYRLVGGLDLWHTIREESALLRAAEAVGLMNKMFEDTLEYLRTREQFGKTLGSFQALQHRMVAQYVGLNECRALLERITLQENKADRSRAIAGARAAIAERGIALSHEAIQLHGGMGVSDELPIGRYHKRLVFLTQYPADGERAFNAYAGITAP
jgi:alkylation response protein AidB-like acyl-CoA dehydrogenase